MLGTVYTPGSFAWVRSGPGTSYQTVGKLSHGASVTVLESVAGPAVNGGKPIWYKIGDGRYVYSGLVRAASPLTPAPQPSPQPHPQPGPGKWIEIDLSDHTLTAWDGDKVFLTTLVSIGKPSTPTVKGTFRVYAKYRSVNMSGPGYYQPNVPHTMFFYGGYAIHGAYWRKTFGENVSHGCVNVNLTDAARLYEWTPIGTTVVIRS
jgi:hypothetical protein